MIFEFSITQSDCDSREYAAQKCYEGIPASLDGGYRTKASFDRRFVPKLKLNPISSFMYFQFVTNKLILE